MGCNYPIPASQDESGTVKLWPRLGTASIAVPCGNCMGCLTAKAEEWALRATHEASQHAENKFVTLTYDDDQLPENGSVSKAELQRFWKRLRKQTGQKIRYFACGEYGDIGLRPHYHAIIFGLTLADETKIGKYKHSDELTKIWGKGHTTIGEVNSTTARYVAKYQLKQRHREHITEDGELLSKPFLMMSRKPRIGATWLQKYKEDIQNGYIVTDNRKTRIPRAYLKELSVIDPQLGELAAHRAQSNARCNTDNQSEQRREAREQILKQRNHNRSRA